MIIDKEQYINVKNEVIKYSIEYQSKDSLNMFASHIEDKINNFKPTIMVYGTYNSGKSTLINALFGKDELAKTGDAPETSTVSAYEYNGYTLYDTPGINAPQEHEHVTNEHLKKCELVLFILSNDGSFEEKYIYEKISEIVKLEKPILIVVNNKVGLEKDSIQEVEQFDKINLNLSKIGDENGIESIETKVNISMVNAKTALKAKLGNKQLLLTSSNIFSLENEIDKLLKKSGNSEVVNALNGFISDYINDTLAVMDSKIDNPEMKKTQEAITYLEKLKQRTYIELKNTIQESSTIMVQNLLELFLQKDQNLISDFIKKITKETQELLNTKLKAVSSEISSKINNFNEEFSELSISADNIKPLADNTSTNAVSNSSNSNIKNATLAGAAVVVNVIPPVIPIGTVPVPARLIAQIAIAFFGVFSGSSEEKSHAQAEVDEKREQYLAAKNKSDEFGYDYKNKLFSSIDESLNGLFNPTLEKFTQFSKQLDSDNTKLLKDKHQLQSFLRKL
ncbi:MAG: GTPase [Campylobacterota bacterium]|nr:GTPase [Campylobacterota bacterium]